MLVNLGIVRQKMNHFLHDMLLIEACSSPYSVLNQPCNPIRNLILLHFVIEDFTFLCSQNYHIQFVFVFYSCSQLFCPRMPQQLIYLLLSSYLKLV